MKDLYCSYYTESEDITSYMVSKLGIHDNDLILEPSAGEGIFIDEVLKHNCKLRIDALDINEGAISILEKKYSNNPSVTVRLTDTLFDEVLDGYSVSEIWLKNTDVLLDEQLDYFSMLGGHYDKVIGNPPYGAWQDYSKRDLLKKKYAGQYVKETYTLFLLRCLSVLKIGGRLSFIIPDTFLFLNMHERLRKILLSNTKIEELLIFPSKFFPGVSFGYSNLSIITFEKCDRDTAFSNVIKVVKGFKNSLEFADVSKGTYPAHLEVFELNQKNIYYSENSRFVLAGKGEEAIMSFTERKLGDIADVVTGFYSGDNKKFVCAANDKVKGAKNYSIVDPALIYECDLLDGIFDVGEGYVPYIKSSSATRYMREKDEWYVRWDRKTVRFYNEDKKARFQNSKYYFKKGIAIPMVKSREVRATVMDKRVFDQSVVGIFPRDEKDFFYILGFMNSDIANKLIHIINPTANNSSNYVKQIPFIEPTKEQRKTVEDCVKQILELDVVEDAKAITELHLFINEVFDNIYS